MTKTSLLPSIAILAVALAACVGSDDRHPEEVAVTEQALGGFEMMIDFGSDEVLDVGPTYTVSRRYVGACTVPDVYLTATGELVSVPPLPAACPVLVSATSRTKVLVHDATTRKIYMLVHGFITNWVELASTGQQLGYDMVANDTDLFWHDGYWTHRFSLTTFQELPGWGGFEGDILALGDGFLYTRADLDGDEYGLFRIYRNGFSAIARSTHDFRGVSLNSDHAYWAERGATSKIFRAAYSNAVTTLKSSTKEDFYAPVSNGAALWWVDRNKQTGSTHLRRRNLSNGNQISIPFPYPPPDKMWLFDDGIYFLHRDVVASTSVLYRTSR